MKSSKDVARKAGVSQSTVSRVLNNPDLVKPETRHQVLNAMQELGYYPNLIARSLVTNTTHTIALVSGTLKNSFFTESTDSIVRTARTRGYKTITYFEDEGVVPDFVDSIMGYKVDGLLLSLIGLEDPVIKIIEESGIPCVFYNRKPRNGWNFIELDNKKAVRLVTHHLLELGHRRIAYISGETNVSTFYERKMGFEEALGKDIISSNKELIHYVDTSSDMVDGLIRYLIALDKPPTAILCATDAIAMVCMNTLMSLGIRIPEDISLAGIDNVSLDAHQAVQLTTVGTRGLDMGALAANMLVDLIENDNVDKPKQIVLEPELFIRKTTGRRR